MEPSTTRWGVCIIRAEAGYRWEDTPSYRDAGGRQRLNGGRPGVLDGAQGVKMVRFQPIHSVVSCCSAGV
jgi:hypothetical protein